MRPLQLLVSGALMLVALTSGCGRPALNSRSSLQERHETPANNVTAEDTRLLLSHIKAISTADTHTGSIPVKELLNVMPLKNDQRSIIAAAYTGSFAVTCQNGICQAQAQGRSSQATMDVNISGLPAYPSLVLGDSVKTGFAMRGDDVVEFCNIQGMWAKKFFISRVIQGLQLTLQNNVPYLSVNVGNDSENYTCQ